jgi:hypothetical protein
MKSVGRFGPLPSQIQIYLTPSGIDRQLSSLSAVIGVLVVRPLQRSQVLAVVVLIKLLQCSDHGRLSPYLLLGTFACAPKASQSTIVADRAFP